MTHIEQSSMEHAKCCFCKYLWFAFGLIVLKLFLKALIFLLWIKSVSTKWLSYLMRVPSDIQYQIHYPYTYTDRYDLNVVLLDLRPHTQFLTPTLPTTVNVAYIFHYNMVRWISAPGTMHFCPQYDTFWPCGLFTLLQFCKHPPSKISMKLRWVSSVNLVNCGDIFNLLTILSSPEINDSF